MVPIEDEDVEQPYLNMFSAQSEYINDVDVEAVVEQIADEVVVEKDDTRHGEVDKVKADVEEQAIGVVEQMVMVKQNEVIVSAVDQGLAKSVVSYRSAVVPQQM